MRTDPLVTIVVPSRGGDRFLPGLFEALRRQSTSDWEAVVVLDGVVDDSEEIVRCASTDLPVRSIVFASNLGRAAALNAGFQDAKGQILVRCDDDMVPDPSYVSHHAAGHEDAEVGIVGLARNIYPDTTYARTYGRTWDERYRRDAYGGAQPAWHYWAGNCSVSRKTWERVGPYDTAFRSYGWEDVDWGYRLHLAGVPIRLDPNLEIDHLGPAATTPQRAQRAFYAGAAKRRFEAKHGIDAPRPSTQGSKASTWNLAVSSLESRLNEDRIVRLGRAIDRSAVALPPAVSQKAIALLVEASSIAGHRSSGTQGAI